MQECICNQIGQKCVIWFLLFQMKHGCGEYVYMMHKIASLEECETVY